MRIRDLRPGDRLDGAPTGESATLISWSVPHPVHPGLALVVWRMGDGRLSLDALDPEQHDVTGSTVVAQSEDERLESLRRAIDGPHPAVSTDSAPAAGRVVPIGMHAVLSGEILGLDPDWVYAVLFAGDPTPIPLRPAAGRDVRTPLERAEDELRRDEALAARRIHGAPAGTERGDDDR